MTSSTRAHASLFDDDEALLDDAVASLPNELDPLAWPLHVPATTTIEGERDQQYQSSPNSVNGLMTAHGTTVKMEALPQQMQAYASGMLMDEEAITSVSALDLKRVRNRECMRRSRQRKQDKLDGMKEEITQLEKQLRAQQMQKREALKREPKSDGESHSSLQHLFVALQDENVELRDAIRVSEKLREVVAPLLEQEEERKTIDGQHHMDEGILNDQFAWLRHVLPILALRSMSPTDVASLVHESCAEILASAHHADGSIESPNRVLGWSDKRIVDSRMMHFMFSKDFAHQQIEDAVAKSWETSSDLDKVTAFQPREQSMMVVHKWDDDTLVIARNLNVSQRASDGSEDRQNFCSVILVFRIQTATGYVIGTRTLAAIQVQEALQNAGESHVTYVELCYGLLFTPMDKPSLKSPLSAAVGCNVRFGGRAGNGTRVYAQVCAVDVLLAALRWENHCVAPLNRLTNAMR